MKILSFDIGIKNLAFCLLDSDKDSIEDWGIINISIDPVCEHMIKLKQCDKTAKAYINDIRYCTSHLNLKMNREKKKKNIKKIKNPILSIGQNIVRLLDEKSNFLEVDVVLLENQPALKNPTMKTIQMIVYSYFLINGLTKSEKPIHNIEMINARNKLKAYKGEPIQCDIKDRYKKTKYLSVEYTKCMIKEQNKTMLQLFNESKKKDDLADAYLQGMFWLYK